MILAVHMHSKHHHTTLDHITEQVMDSILVLETNVWRGDGTAANVAIVEGQESQIKQWMLMESVLLLYEE